MSDAKKPKPQVVWSALRVYKSAWGGTGELRVTFSHPTPERPKPEGSSTQGAKISIDPATGKVTTITVEDL